MRARPLLAAAAALLLGGALSVGTMAADGAKMSDCLSCHEDAATPFAKGPHGKAMAAKSLLEGSCVSCHGPGDAHLQEPSKDNIQMPGSASCLECHAGAAGGMGMTMPGHSRNRLQCLECHVSGHKTPAASPLLAKAPAKLCGGCHQAEAAKADLPSAHRDGSRRFDCTNCHTVHGLGRLGRLRQNRFGSVCLDCHTEKAGPYVYPHPPRDVNGCMACHDPHGSLNQRMLKRTRIADLCIECHASGVPQSHTVHRGRYQYCQKCHVAVHGSNHDSRLFDE